MLRIELTGKWPAFGGGERRRAKQRMWRGGGKVIETHVCRHYLFGERHTRRGRRCCVALKLFVDGKLLKRRRLHLEIWAVQAVVFFGFIINFLIFWVLEKKKKHSVIFELFSTVFLFLKISKIIWKQIIM